MAGEGPHMFCDSYRLGGQPQACLIEPLRPQRPLPDEVEMLTRWNRVRVDGDEARRQRLFQRADVYARVFRARASHEVEKALPVGQEMRPCVYGLLARR